MEEAVDIGDRLLQARRNARCLLSAAGNTSVQFPEIKWLLSTSKCKQYDQSNSRKLLGRIRVQNLSRVSEVFSDSQEKLTRLIGNNRGNQQRSSQKKMRNSDAERSRRKIMSLLLKYGDDVHEVFLFSVM